MNLKDIKKGMRVFKNSNEYEVISVDSKQKYPVFAKHVKSGIVGRFEASSLTRSK
jgi:hypothetical protein